MDKDDLLRFYMKHLNHAINLRNFHAEENAKTRTVELVINNAEYVANEGNVYLPKFVLKYKSQRQYRRDNSSELLYAYNKLDHDSTNVIRFDSVDNSIIFRKLETIYSMWRMGITD